MPSSLSFDSGNDEKMIEVEEEVEEHEELEAEPVPEVAPKKSGTNKFWDVEQLARSTTSRPKTSSNGEASGI
jgi:hypothetical protein